MACLAFAASANATIVAGTSIAGVEIGAKESVVTKLLGKPDDIKVQGGGRVLHWDQPRLSVTIESKKVTAVRTKSGDDKTPTGVGRGTKLSQLRASLVGEQCKGTACVLFQPAGHVTVFMLRRNAVVSVAVFR